MQAGWLLCQGKKKKTCRGSYLSFSILNVHVSLLLRPEVLLVRSGVSSMS